MNDIYFLHTPPEVGQQVTISTWELLGITDEMVDNVLGPATITAVEQQDDSEWNPVIKERETVTYTYVTLRFNDRYYRRRAFFNTPRSARADYTLSPTVPDETDPDTDSD